MNNYNNRNSLYLWRGQISDPAQTLNSDGFAAVNVTVNGKSIPGDDVVTVPTMTPYGLLGVPENNSNALGAYITGTIQNPVVLGLLSAFTDADYRVAGLEEGESALYSTAFSRLMKNDGCFYTSQVSDPFTATALIGEWIKKILVDVINQLEATYAEGFANVEQQFAMHVHPIPGDTSGSPTTGIDFGTPSEVLEEDLAALEANQIFMTTDGILPPEDNDA
jgi:hypothetical protein